MEKSLLGAHVSFKKDTQLLGALKDLKTIGATSGAFYISNSRGYVKFELDLENIKAGKIFAKENDFDLQNIIVHAPLVGNLANIFPEKKIFELTVQSYIADLKLLKISGLKYYNFHPGSAPDKEKGIKQCAKGINQILSATEGDETILCIETMMKKGNYIGSDFEEIAEIIKLVKNQNRIAVVLDTCHVWDAGYDLRDLDFVLEEFDRIIGLKYLKGLHINDSKNHLGSNKDRHANIGQGLIGLEVLREIINNKYLKNLPKALETPYGKNDFKRWQEEINLLLKK